MLEAPYSVQRRPEGGPPAAVLGRQPTSGTLIQAHLTATTVVRSARPAQPAPVRALYGCCVAFTAQVAYRISELLTPFTVFVLSEQVVSMESRRTSRPARKSPSQLAVALMGLLRLQINARSPKPRDMSCSQESRRDAYGRGKGDYPRSNPSTA